MRSRPTTRVLSAMSRAGKRRTFRTLAILAMLSPLFGAVAYLILATWR